MTCLPHQHHLQSIRITMYFRKTSIIALAVLALGMHVSVNAKEVKIGNLEVEAMHARATVPGQRSGAVYLSIRNHGKESDRLTAVASPIAKGAELHTMSIEGDVMKMREVDMIAIAPASTITMKPGNGYHIMLTGLQKPLTAGATFAVTLTFEKAGKVKVPVQVEGKSVDAPSHEHQHQHQHKHH
jgi:copper(I)-binding protein